MTDEVVERLAEKGAHALWGRFIGARSYTEVRNTLKAVIEDHLRNALRPGDRLPGGLVVVREEATEAAYCAGDEAIIAAIQPDAVLDGTTPAQKCWRAMLDAGE